MVSKVTLNTIETIFFVTGTTVTVIVKAGTYTLIILILKLLVKFMDRFYASGGFFAHVTCVDKGNISACFVVK